MTYTNFPNGVTSFGVPVLGTVGGIPLTGNFYFCDYVNGSDGNTGGAEDPLKTITEAYDRAVAGNNDVIFIVGDGGTDATQRLTETLTWAKDATHLVGITAPTMIGQRARISTLTTATTNINPLMTVSADGCIFANFSFFQGVGQASTDEQLMNITGLRNYFGNIHFGGMGATAGAARAGSYCVLLSAAEENTFENCVFGVDTIARTAANANVKFASAAKRNLFKDCLFLMYTTSGNPLFVDGNSSGSVDRFNWFKNCTFNNAINSGSGAVTAACVGFHASQGGTTVMDNCSAIGCTDWTATDTGVVQILGPVPNGDTSGMSVNSNAT